MFTSTHDSVAAAAGTERSERYEPFHFNDHFKEMVEKGVKRDQKALFVSERINKLPPSVQSPPANHDVVKCLSAEVAYVVRGKSYRKGGRSGRSMLNPNILFSDKM